MAITFLDESAAILLLEGRPFRQKAVCGEFNSIAIIPNVSWHLHLRPAKFLRRITANQPRPFDAAEISNGMKDCGERRFLSIDGWTEFPTAALAAKRREG